MGRHRKPSRVRDTVLGVACIVLGVLLSLGVLAFAWSLS